MNSLIELLYYGYIIVFILWAGGYIANGYMGMNFELKSCWFMGLILLTLSYVAYKFKADIDMDNGKKITEPYADIIKRGTTFIRKETEIKKDS